MTGIGIAARDPGYEPLRGRPMPRRWFTFGLLFPVIVTAAGGVAFVVHAGMVARGHPVPKPGPRRYPPGYHTPVSGTVGKRAGSTT
jgi:hypothetical protein